MTGARTGAALWVLEASGPEPIRLQRRPGCAVEAASWSLRLTGDGPVFHHTFLLAADGHAPAALAALAGRGVWAVDVRPAPDGTYVDAQTRAAVVVRDGAVVPPV